MARSIWKSLDITIFRNPRFPIFLMGSSLSAFGYLVPCVFIPILAVADLDMSPYTSSFLLTAWAVSTICGRISSGLMGDRLPFFKRPGRRVYMYAVPNIFSGLCTAAVYVIRSQEAFIFYCVLFGFLTGKTKFKMLIATGEIFETYGMQARVASLSEARSKWQAPQSRSH